MTAMTEQKRIYLAGPDIYHPDAQQRGLDMVALCARYGHQATFPLRHPFQKGTQRQCAIWLYNTNARLITNSDLIIANLNPYRGSEPDTGTAYEIGYAIAKGIPVIGYRNAMGTMRDQYGLTDLQGDHIEDHGLPVTLMLGTPVQLIQGGLQQALIALNAQLEKEQQLSPLAPQTMENKIG